VVPVEPVKATALTSSSRRNSVFGLQKTSMATEAVLGLKRLLVELEVT
jgi:hypothetical protein